MDANNRKILITCPKCWNEYELDRGICPQCGNIIPPEMIYENNLYNKGKIKTGNIIKKNTANSDILKEHLIWLVLSSLAIICLIITICLLVFRETIIEDKYIEKQHIITVSQGDV